MSDKQESIVIVKEPQRLFDAIVAFREEAESIEFQRLYGDEARGPLKCEFDEAVQTLVTYFRHQNGVLSELFNRVEAIEDRLNQITNMIESLASLLVTDVEEDQAECACSSCGCGGWVDFVYENADIEDGVQAVVTGLAGDECDCDMCREVPYGRS